MDVLSSGSSGNQAELRGGIHGICHSTCRGRCGAPAGAGEAIVATASGVVGGSRLGGFNPAGTKHALDGAIQGAGAEADGAAGFDLLHDAIAMELAGGEGEEDFEFDWGGEGIGGSSCGHGGDCIA